MNKGLAIWLTGLPSSGKTTLAQFLAELLRNSGACVEILDGDELRRSLSADLGFSAADRKEQTRRVAYVSKLLVRNGITVIVPLISPYRDARQFAREAVENFVEVYVDCPVEECIRRDVKGLYARALKGEIANFTGISDPYEPPFAPEITVNTAELSIDESVELILSELAQLGHIENRLIEYTK